MDRMVQALQFLGRQRLRVVMLQVLVMAQRPVCEYGSVGHNREIDV